MGCPRDTPHTRVYHFRGNPAVAVWTQYMAEAAPDCRAELRRAAHALDNGNILDEEQLEAAMARDLEHYKHCRRTGTHPLQGLPAITQSRARQAALFIAEELAAQDQDSDHD